MLELLGQFWHHATSYYRKPDGRPTSTLENFKQVMRPLKDLYGTLAVTDFTPLKLQTVQQHFLEKRWRRQSVNRGVGRIKQIFRWGVTQEIVPAAVYQALQAVSGLREGRSPVRESDPVLPVPQAHIDAVKPFLSRQVWAMIQLQLLTAARPGEVVRLRPVDLDMSGSVWIYTPADHKTVHHGHQRKVFLGPQAQDIVREFLPGRCVDAYLFSPQEAEAQRYAQAAIHRRPNQKPAPPKTPRKLGDHYAVGSYRHAIHRACDNAKVPRWGPHRLRHNAATFIRQKYGLEAAQIMLGHRKADVTQLYAEINLEKGQKIAANIG
jgi:integrase